MTTFRLNIMQLSLGDHIAYKLRADDEARLVLGGGLVEHVKRVGRADLLPCICLAQNGVAPRAHGMMTICDSVALTWLGTASGNSAKFLPSPNVRGAVPT